MIKTISFDLDGTLWPEDIDKFIWNEEIPQLYADKNNITIEESKKIVYARYYRAKYVQEEIVKNWTSIEGWFQRLDLGEPDIKRMMKFKKNLKVYDEVEEVLKYLSVKYRLIIITNTAKWFMNHKLCITGTKKYFQAAYSQEQFGKMKKDPKIYEEILKIEGIKPEELLHIGDSELEDKEIPELVNINTILINREGGSADITNLKQVLPFINKLNKTL